MSEQYSVTLNRKQIAKLCEEYVLSQTGTRIGLQAKADVDLAQKAITVRVSTKRARKAKVAT